MAAEQRYEEAADVRERAAALTQALRRQRRLDGLSRSGRVLVEVRGGGRVELHDGRLRQVWPAEPARAEGMAWAERPTALPFADAEVPVAADELRLVTDDGPEAALPRELADELACVATWLESHAQQVSLLSAERGLTSPLPRLPSFDPRTPADAARRARR